MSVKHILRSIDICNITSHKSEIILRWEEFISKCNITKNDNIKLSNKYLFELKSYTVVRINEMVYFTIMHKKPMASEFHKTKYNEYYEVFCDLRLINLITNKELNDVSNYDKSTNHIDNVFEVIVHLLKNNTTPITLDRNTKFHSQIENSISLNLQPYEIMSNQIESD